MAFTLKKYSMYLWNEFELNFKGRYGARGEPRGARRNKTPREIEYQNRWNKRKYIRRLIKLNFTDGLYVTLTYKTENRKQMAGVKKDFELYRKRLRRRYRKRGGDLKYIYTIEIGSRGGVHIHMIVNRIPEENTDKVISEQWKMGHAHIQTIYEDGDYEQLACYMAKVPQEETGENKRSRIERMEDITEESYDYNTSRNLIKPEPEVKVYKNRTVKKMIEDGPTPTPGYYIIKDSIRTGVNPFTGMSYLYYTEKLIKKKRRE